MTHLWLLGGFMCHTGPPTDLLRCLWPIVPGPASPPCCFLLYDLQPWLSHGHKLVELCLVWAPHTLFISGPRVSQDMLRAPRARPESSGACDALWRSPSTSERELEMYSSSPLLQKACAGKQPLVQPLGRWTHKSGYMTALHKMSVSLMTHLCVALPLLDGWHFSLSSYRVPLPQVLLSEAKTLCILLKRGVIWRCKNTIKLEDSGNIDEKVVNAPWKD